MYTYIYIYIYVYIYIYIHICIHIYVYRNYSTIWWKFFFFCMCSSSLLSLAGLSRLCWTTPEIRSASLMRAGRWAEASVSSERSIKPRFDIRPRAVREAFHDPCMDVSSFQAMRLAKPSLGTDSKVLTHLQPSAVAAMLCGFRFLVESMARAVSARACICLTWSLVPMWWVH